MELLSLVSLNEWKICHCMFWKCSEVPQPVPLFCNSCYNVNISESQSKHKHYCKGCTKLNVHHRVISLVLIYICCFKQLLMYCTSEQLCTQFTVRFWLRYLCNSAYRNDNDPLIRKGQAAKYYVIKTFLVLLLYHLLHHNNTCITAVLLQVHWRCSHAVLSSDVRSWITVWMKTTRRGIHRWPLNSPCKWPVTQKMFPFDDIIMDSPHKETVMEKAFPVPERSSWQYVGTDPGSLVPIRRQAITWTNGHQYRFISSIMLSIPIL